MAFDYESYYTDILSNYEGARRENMAQAINRLHQGGDPVSPPDIATLEKLTDEYERTQPSEISKGWESGLQNLQATGYGALGLAGSALGSDTLRNIGYEGYKRNIQEASDTAPRVASVTDVGSFEDASDWVMGTIGQLAPSLLEAAVSVAAGGGVAGLAGKTVLKNRIRSQIAKEVAKGVSEEVAKKAVAASLIQAGKSAGLVLGVGAMEAGGNFGEAAGEVGVENVNPAVIAGTGLASGLTELYSPTGMFLRKAGPGMASKAAKKLTTIGARAASIPKAMIEEGTQEAVQQGLSDVSRLYHNPEAEISGKDYLNAAAAGAVGGFIPGAANVGLSVVGAPKPLSSVSTDMINEARKETVPDADINQQAAEQISKPPGGIGPGLETAQVEQELNDPAVLARVENQRRMDEATQDDSFADMGYSGLADQNLGVPDNADQNIDQMAGRGGSNEAYPILQPTGDTEGSPGIDSGTGIPPTAPEQRSPEQDLSGREIQEKDVDRASGDRRGNKGLGHQIQDPDQRQFIQNKVQSLGSIEAVDKYYFGKDKVAKYGRQYAREVFGVNERQPTETDNSPKQKEISKNKQPKNAKNYPEGVRLTSKGRPYKKRGAENAAAIHTKKTGEQTELVSLGGKDRGWRVVGKIADQPSVETVTEPIGESSKKIDEKPRIGEGRKVGGIDSILADYEVVDGVSYELYNANKLKDKRAVVYVKDVDSGETVSTKIYPDFDAAEKEFKKTIEIVSHKTPVGETQTGLSSTDETQTELSTPKKEQPIQEPPGEVSKEPWEMTRDEYVIFTAKRRLEKAESEPQKSNRRMERERLSEIQIAKGFLGAAEGSGDKIRYRDDISIAGDRHALDVKQALSEGKSVPKEVLADYPGLAKSKEKAGDDARRLPQESVNTPDTAGKQRADKIADDKSPVQETPAQISELSPKQRRTLTALTRKGKVEIVSNDAAQEVMSGDAKGMFESDGKTQGFFLNGKAYIIPENIKAGGLWPVLRHEIGVHMGQLMQSRPEFKRILKTLENLKEKDSEQGRKVKEAFDRVPEGTNPEHVTEEALAYLIENSPEIGIVRRFVTMIKRLLVKLGVSPTIFTREDYAAMADAALKREAKHGIEVSYRGEQMPKFSKEPGEEPSLSVEEREASYEKNREISKDTKAAIKRKLKAVTYSLAKGVDKFLGASSTRLRNIHPKIEARFRKLDFAIGTHSTRDVKAVEPLLRKAQKSMTLSDFKDWDYARKNGDKDKINSLIDKYDLKEEYKAYRDTLNRVRDEAIRVGMDVKFIKEYSPRVLKDSQGFLNHIGKGDDWPVIAGALQDRAKKIGVSIADMTPEMKADTVSNMLFGGAGLTGRPGNIKERAIKNIPAELNQYYMDSDSALVHYLYNMRKHIEIRNFTGRVPKIISQAKSAMHQAQARLRKAVKEEREKFFTENPDAKRYQPAEESMRIKGIKETIRSYRNILDGFRQDVENKETIAQYILELEADGILSPKDERVLVDILRARFAERGTHGLIQAYKNLSYIDTMGSPISAITQIGDLAWSVYANGWYKTGKAIYKAVRGKSVIKKEDVGIERIAQEFADSDTLSSAVAKVFKWVGLEKLDTIGKEALLNGAHEKYMDEAKKDPDKLRDKIKDIFEDETDSVIDDLKSGEITDNVKLLVYSKLLDFQPASLSEMSEQYLRAGNGRLFYMLKSYTLKQFDIFRREVYNDLKNGNPEQKLKAVKNLAYLSSLIVIANAGADEIKDWVLGRETTLEDRTVDNILRLLGVSKYVTWKARTEGVGTAIGKQILPPFNFVDSLYKDIVSAGDDKGLKTVSSIPIVGKLAYWHMGRGQDNRKDLWEQRFSDKRRKLNGIKDKIERHPNLRSKYRKEMAEFVRINKAQGSANRMKSRINKMKAKNLDASRIEESRIRLLKSAYEASR